MLPNFFLVGTQKAATTTLHNYLVDHPEIYLPQQKETKFFVKDSLYDKGINFYEEEFFSAWDGQSAVGEIDPDYMYFEQALERMQEHLDFSALKLIFIFRNPVERAFSHYLMTYRRGVESLSFEEAIAHESNRISQSYDANMHYSYLSRGYYLQQVERFLEHINRKQMLFLLTEDLMANPRSSLLKIFKFLNVSTEYMPHNLGTKYHGAKVPINTNLQRRIVGGDSVEKKLLRLLIPYQPLREKLRTKLLSWNQKPAQKLGLNDNTRRYLAGAYQAENYRLEKFLGQGLQHWECENTSQDNDK